MKTDYKTIQVELKDGVAVIIMNNPPVNQLSERFSNELTDVFKNAFEDPEILAVVLTGTGNNFIAGADITRIQGAVNREDILQATLAGTRFISSLETGPKPVIAAINGNCLGAGLEIAMACHFRVAAKGATLGQPEVQIGLIPGAGGTQRLPRLIGLRYALEMITTGKPVKSKTAYERGLVDALTDPDSLLEKAMDAAAQFISGKLNIKMRMTRHMHHWIPSAAEKTAMMDFAKVMVAAQSKGYIAPMKALEAIDKGLSYDIDIDLEREAALFADCAVSDVARNLIGIFFNTRSAGKLDRIKGIEPAEIKKVAMLGGGVMGSGIVNLLLMGGCETILWDINEDALTKGLASIRKTFAYPIKKRKMTSEALERMLETQLKTTTDLKDLADVDLVIEAVLEDMQIKQNIWNQLQAICSPHTVFATNTSALPITEMAKILTDPARMLGLHFFNPAHRMQLLEIICAKATSNQTLATCVAFARRIKKIMLRIREVRIVREMQCQGPIGVLPDSAARCYNLVRGLEAPGDFSPQLVF